MIFTNSSGKLFTITPKAHGPMSYLQKGTPGSLSLPTFGLNIDGIAGTVDQLRNLKNLNFQDIKHSAKSYAMSTATDMGNAWITKNLNLGNGTIGQVQNIYKGIVGGDITAMVSATKLVQKFGNFGFKSSLGMSPGALGGKLPFGQGPIMANLGTAWNAVGGWANTAMASFKTWRSDVRLKEEIQLIGKSQAGINIYRFKYKDTNGTYQGVMAQEVLWASEMTDTGYYMVDYSKLDVDFRKLN
jgi:hypothetical protein